MKRGLLIFLLIPTLVLSQSKLKTAKENLSSRSSNSSSSTSSSNSNDDARASSFFAQSFGYAFLELFVRAGVYSTVKLGLGDFQSRHFTPYPYYYDNVHGEYDFGSVDGDKKSLTRIGANYLVGNIVNSAEVQLEHRFTPFFGATLTHQSFFEEVRDGTEYLDVTSLSLNYYRIRERSFTGWWGAGITYAGTDVDALGFTYNLGLEVYPFKPFGIHASFQQSFINRNTINTLRTQIKYHHKKTAFYMGYHDISLAGVKASGVVLGVEFRW